jgi:para-nitrobenzyl esterase
MSKTRFYILLFVFANVSTHSSAQSVQKKNISTEKSDSAIALTQNGFVRGMIESSNVAVFLGIPYAAPPTGNLRWKPPIDPQNWGDTLATLTYGPSCPQVSKDNGPTNEDCLYLNVFTSSTNFNESGAKKPIMFWIHGGGFLGGSARGYDGRVLARKGVVVVTINYRLGPFGYLCHPALEASSANKGAGNYGLLDQIAALKWVNKNIQAFGGDPDNVTIWGESAGAFSVGALLASPLAKGLFHKAILESGTGLINGIQSKASAMQYAITVAKAVGIERSDSVALKKLYSMSAEQLIAMCLRPQRPQLQNFYIWFSPIVDGWAIPLALDKAIAQNKWNNVPLLLGSNQDEGVYFQREKPTSDIVEYYNLLGKESLGDDSGILKVIYAVTDSSEILGKSQELVSDFAFGAPARALARMCTLKNEKTFLYYFTRT